MPAGHGCSISKMQAGLLRRRRVRSRFDRRVISEQALDFIRACQEERVPCHLAGGVAVAGTILRYRLSRDIDLFVHDREAHRELVNALPEISQLVSSSVQILRDGGNHVRGRIDFGGDKLELDLVHEALPDLDAAVEVESILVESERDLHASKTPAPLPRRPLRNGYSGTHHPRTEHADAD